MKNYYICKWLDGKQQLVVNLINLNYSRQIRGVTVHSVTSNTLRDAQKSCICMISRGMSRVFCDLRSQKTPRGTLAVNSNKP